MQGVTQDRPLLSVEPMKVADHLIRTSFTAPRGGKGLWSFRGDFYHWYGEQWRIRDSQWLEDMCWNLLEDAQYVQESADGSSIVRRLHPTRAKIADILRALEAKCRIPHSICPVWLSGEDEKPSASGLIAFKDVLVDVRSGGVVNRDETWFDPQVIPCEWDPKAECPRWMQALEEWGGGCEEWSLLLQRWMGYCLLSHRRHAKWMLMYGKVRSGKGTISRVLENMVGRDLYLGTSLDELSGEFGLDGLERSRVMVVSEVSELDGRDGERATRVLKNIVGGDPISVNVKFKRQLRNVVVNAAPIIQANEIPQLPNKGRGLSSKMLVLPFDVSFEGREDVYLVDRLLEELPGIARWCVEGAMGLEREEDTKKRFPMTKRGEEAVKLYHLQNNPFDHFLEERFIANSKGFVATEMLWNQWLDWLEANGVRGLHVPRNQIALKIESLSSWNVWRFRPHGGKRGLKGLGLRKRFEEIA